MPSKQLTIPGLELSSSPSKQPKPRTKDKLTILEGRVLALELEVTLIRIQMGDKEHA